MGMFEPYHSMSEAQRNLDQEVRDFDEGYAFAARGEKPPADSSRSFMAGFEKALHDMSNYYSAFREVDDNKLPLAAPDENA